MNNRYPLLRLVSAELRHRPGRIAFLLTGYAIGVAVMVVLLAVGEAMLEQSRDQALLGGGDLVVVPAGVSTEMLRTGGVGSLFLGVDQARFLQREVLEGPRGRDDYGILAASPILDGKRFELIAGERVVPVIATGEIPSRAALAGAAPTLLAGSWTDSEADRRWANPTAAELYRSIDRFHVPSGAAARDSTWAEWHYFNVVLDEHRWIYLTFMVTGRMADPDGWEGRILLTSRGPDGTHRSATREFDARDVAFDTASPDLRFGTDSYVRLEGSTYHVVARLPEQQIELELHPTPHRYFPPTDLGGTELISGYVVPALHATASGRVCLEECHSVEQGQAYHDHNWGVWRGVSWEWGTASSAELSLLYGTVRGEGTADQGIFAYLVDERGPLEVFRPREIQTRETRFVEVNGTRVEAPRRLLLEDPRRGVGVEIEITSVHATDLGREPFRFFLQMRGVATVSSGGRELGRLPGFFESYVDAAAP
jgi:hypothetical protein